jgi:enamine deaminase RidA (YjgF/YER057c/UK114 family)
VAELTGTAVPRPQGDYAAVVVHGTLAMTAGMTPRVDGRLFRQGRIGDTVTLDDARECVRIATSNGLRVLEDRLGGLDAIAACLRMTVYLACVPDFEDHSRLADVGSAVLREHLGERGTPVRSAVGVATLPGGSPVEVELTVALVQG